MLNLAVSMASATGSSLSAGFVGCTASRRACRTPSLVEPRRGGPCLVAGSGLGSSRRSRSNCLCLYFCSRRQLVVFVRFQRSSNRRSTRSTIDLLQIATIRTLLAVDGRPGGCSWLRFGSRIGCPFARRRSIRIRCHFRHRCAHRSSRPLHVHRRFVVF